MRLSGAWVLILRKEDEPIEGVFIKKIPIQWKEGIELYGAFDYLRVTVKRSTAPIWHCFKPFVAHIQDYIKEDENEIIMENILNENEKNEINEKKEDTNVKSTDVVVDATPISENVEARIPDLKWEEYMHPDFPWPKKSLWINNPKAVQYWINTKNGTPKELNRLRQEEEDTKTY